VPTRDDGQSRVTRKSEEIQDAPEPAEATAEVADRRAKLTGEVDDLLDEIDDVLEENAEEFVRSYVQKGGQ